MSTLEVDYQVRRLSSHPSIALWCGDNELVGALTWFDESRKDRDRYLVSYDRLNRTIEQAMKKASPDAIWWPSSPASGYLDFGDAWHADGSGDMHYWSVWHENKSFDNYRSVRPRFCSEFGFQSYTSLPVIKTYADAKDMNVASPVMELHQKNAGGNERIAGTMFRYFRFPKDFPNFVYLEPDPAGSGDQDGGGILAVAEAALHGHHLLAAQRHLAGRFLVEPRLRRPLEGDALSRQALLPAGGGCRHSVRKTARRSGFRWSTTHLPRSASISRSRSSTMKGVRKHLRDVQAGLQRRMRPSRRHPSMSPILPAGTLLAWRFTASNGMGGEGHYVHGTYKALELEPAGLMVTHEYVEEDGSVCLNVTAKGLALFVMIETETDGKYSDNAFDLAAGETRRITFTPAKPLDGGVLPEFRFYDLHSCQSVD